MQRFAHQRLSSPRQSVNRTENRNVSKLVRSSGGRRRMGSQLLPACLGRQALCLPPTESANSEARVPQMTRAALAHGCSPRVRKSSSFVSPQPARSRSRKALPTPKQLLTLLHSRWLGSCLRLLGSNSRPERIFNFMAKVLGIDLGTTNSCMAVMGVATR